MIALAVSVGFVGVAAATPPFDYRTLPTVVERWRRGVDAGQIVADGDVVWLILGREISRIDAISGAVLGQASPSWDGFGDASASVLLADRVVFGGGSRLATLDRDTGEMLFERPATPRVMRLEGPPLIAELRENATYRRLQGPPRLARLDPRNLGVLVQRDDLGLVGLARGQGDPIVLATHEAVDGTLLLGLRASDLSNAWSLPLSSSARVVEIDGGFHVLEAETGAVLRRIDARTGRLGRKVPWPVAWPDARVRWRSDTPPRVAIPEGLGLRDSPEHPREVILERRNAETGVVSWATTLRGPPVASTQDERRIAMACAVTGRECVLVVLDRRTGRILYEAAGPRRVTRLVLAGDTVLVSSSRVIAVSLTVTGPPERSPVNVETRVEELLAEIASAAKVGTPGEWIVADLRALGPAAVESLTARIPGMSHGALWSIAPLLSRHRPAAMPLLARLPEHAEGLSILILRAAEDADGGATLPLAVALLDDACSDQALRRSAHGIVTRIGGSSAAFALRRAEGAVGPGMPWRRAPAAPGPDAAGPARTLDDGSTLTLFSVCGDLIPCDSTWMLRSLPDGSVEGPLLVGSPPDAAEINSEWIADVARDSDGDGLTDRLETRLHLNPFTRDSDADGDPDPLDVTPHLGWDGASPDDVALAAAAFDVEALQCGAGYALLDDGSFLWRPSGGGPILRFSHDEEGVSWSESNVFSVDAIPRCPLWTRNRIVLGDRSSIPGYWLETIEPADRLVSTRSRDSIFRKNGDRWSLLQDFRLRL